MRLFPTFFLVILSATCTVLAAQTPAEPVPAAAPPVLRTPSAIMQPALDTLRQTLGVLRPDKWKTSDAARQEADANVSSIEHDLEATLPALLAAADKAPDSVVQIMPAYRNVEALYDVLLRIVGTGNLAAPGQQVVALEQARASLEDAQRSLGERLNSAGLAQEHQIRSLQAALRAVPPPPAPVVCPKPPPPVRKRRRYHKPVPKPAAKPAPATQQNGTSTGH